MAQAGIHGLVGALARKITPKLEWLELGIILGSLFPDLDSYAVAVATVGKLDARGLHRTFTHSLLAILIAIIAFFVVAQVRKQPRWANLGLGFGIGIGLHIALDLLLWFNGVALLWPLGGWVNLWEGVKPPEWFAKLMDPAEFLFFALFFVWLAQTARAYKTNADFLGKLRGWTIVMFIFLVVFTPLVYLMSKGFLTILGLFYIISLTAAFMISIRMRQTIEAFS
jgi:membrane-bound metal-dependent hydrolase YbcI (DUF457 family)